MAAEELKAIAGSDNVLDGPDILAEYSGDIIFVPHIRPRCIVKPASTDEIKAIVDWANRSDTPLIPVSSGTPHFHGDTIPAVEGEVIVDLRRMKKIHYVDADNQVAMIEPGVTFGELQNEVGKYGMSAYLPLSPRSSKSVIGSFLEREPITIPSQHWDSTDPLLCMEVVFGTGDKIRTGEAMGPDTIEEQRKLGKAQLNPFGPSHMDIQRLVMGAQGTMGIVTWATLKIRPAAKVNKAYLIPSEHPDPLIDLMYRMLKFRLGANLFVLNGLNLANLTGNTDRESRKLISSLPQWILFASFEGYGPLPEEKVAYQSQDFLEAAGKHGLRPVTHLHEASADEVLRVATRPSSEPYWKLRPRGECQDIFFLTTLDKTSAFVSLITKLADDQGFEAENTGIYIQPTVQGTNCHCEFNLYYDPARPDEVDVARKLMSKGAGEIARMGGFFSRPYGDWKEAAYKGSPRTAELQKKVKQIFDPKGILNPGKLCF